MRLHNDKRKALKQLKELGFKIGNDSRSGATHVNVYTPEGVLVGAYTFAGKQACDTPKRLQSEFKHWQQRLGRYAR